MNSNFNKIIEAERQRYLDHFTKTIEELREGNETCATELVIQPDEPESAAPFSFIRVDFIDKDENDEYSISDIRLNEKPSFSSVQFPLHDIEITLNPFCWNSCTILTDTVNADRLAQWMIDWLKIDQEEEDELAEAIHSCTEPEEVEDSQAFTIDFGTAPAKALLELLKVLGSSGTKKLTIDTVEI